MDYFYGTLGFLDLQSVRLSSLLYEEKKKKEHVFNNLKIKFLKSEPFF